MARSNTLSGSREECFGYPTVRFTLLIMNSLMMALAVPVLVLSMSILLRHDDQVKEGYLIQRNYATYASVLLASTSSIMIMLGVIGQVSIWNSFIKGTVVYMWTSMAVITCQLLIIGCIFVWKDHLYHMIKLNLDDSLGLYIKLPVVRDHWDHLQTSLQCCGDEGPHTWHRVFNPELHNMTLPGSYQGQTFDDPSNQYPVASSDSSDSLLGYAPTSCFKNADLVDFVECQVEVWPNSNSTVVPNNVNKTAIPESLPTKCSPMDVGLEMNEKGCVEAVTEYLISHINFIAYFGLAFVLTQMIAAVLAFRLRNLSEKIHVLQ